MPRGFNLDGFGPDDQPIDEENNRESMGKTPELSAKRLLVVMTLSRSYPDQNQNYAFTRARVLCDGSARCCCAGIREAPTGPFYKKEIKHETECCPTSGGIGVLGIWMR